MVEDVKRLRKLLTPPMEAEPKPKPVMQPYMPPVTYPSQLEVVRKDDEAISRVREEIPSKQNGSNSNPPFNFITHNIASVLIKVSKTIDDEVQPTSR